MKENEENQEYKSDLVKLLDKYVSLRQEKFAIS